MRNLRSMQLLLLLLPLFASGIPAQTHITLGRSTADLTGPWKFHPGDDPRWADPAFDDASWPTLDLTPVPGSIDPSWGTDGFVPGWTSRGYASLSGFAWYRLRLDVQARENTPLALKIPMNVEDAYQVFLDGHLIGQSGSFTADKVVSSISQPSSFRLPPGTGSRTIAIRIWMSPVTPLLAPQVGGMHGPPIFGEASIIDDLVQLDWRIVGRSTTAFFVETALILLATIIAFSLHRMDRTRPAYLWLSINAAAFLLLMILVLLNIYTPLIGAARYIVVTTVLFEPFVTASLILFWGHWFRLIRTNIRLERTIWALALTIGGIMALLWLLLFHDPVHSLPIVYILSRLVLLPKVALGVLLLWITFRGIRRSPTEGLLALPAVLLGELVQYWRELAVLHAPQYLAVFGYRIHLAVCGYTVFMGMTLLLLLRRFLHSQRLNEQIRLEVEQARQVQHILIPDATPNVPGFTLETEYRPAQQVGGDFFQIIPLPTGATLFLVGDVSGKGLKAAMTVSLIVGTLRTLADYEDDPAQLLAGLNRRLFGRLTLGFTTCLALRLSPSGACLFANAGHLPPYLNETELPFEPALPLGVAPDTVYGAITLTLDLKDKLTLYTDGVVEARDVHGTLFGFDRLHALLSLRPTAAFLADSAASFGQEDDITVLTVERQGT